MYSGNFGVHVNLDDLGFAENVSLNLYNNFIKKQILGGGNWCDLSYMKGSASSSDGKASACNAEDPGSIPRLGRSPGEGNGNPLQYSCLENSMDKGAWWATVHGGGKKSDRTERPTPTGYMKEFYIVDWSISVCVFVFNILNIL